MTSDCKTKGEISVKIDSLELTVCNHKWRGVDSFYGGRKRSFKLSFFWRKENIAFDSMLWEWKGERQLQREPKHLVQFKLKTREDQRVVFEESLSQS